MDDYTLLKFTKSFRDFLASDVTLVTLTAYNATTNRSIEIDKGDQEITPPGLILTVDSTVPWRYEVDTIFDSLITCTAYTKDRISSMRIAMAAFNKCRQTSSGAQLQADAKFNSNDIESMSIIPLGFPEDAGQTAGLQPESVRRTERSDAPIADRHVTRFRVMVRWRDTRAL